MMRQTNTTIMTWSAVGALLAGVLVFGCSRQAGPMAEAGHGNDKGATKHESGSVPGEAAMKEGGHSGEEEHAHE